MQQLQPPLSSAPPFAPPVGVVVAGKMVERIPARKVARYALEWGVGISLLIHAVLLSVHFTLPDASHFKRTDKSMEVVLVNSRHARRPEKAELLAQADLDAGGTGEKDARPATPLPPQQQTRVGDGLVEARRRSEQPETPQMQAMTTARSKAVIAADTRQANPTEAPRQVSGYDLLDSAAAVARIEAQIDKDLVGYASRPRKAIIGSSTREYRFAQYVEDWRQKIERVGTLNYPDAARGKVYGSLLLAVTIRADGTVQSIDIHRSSGQKVLDDAARRIVQLAAPYAAFPPDFRKDTDVIEIVRTWTFTNADMLQTSAEKKE